MAGQTWSQWLSGLVAGLWPRLPLHPGSHEALLEERRLSALLEKEQRKPVGQIDEELVHKLRVEFYALGLANKQAALRTYKHSTWCWQRSTRQCCGAAQWVEQRILASYHALVDFYEQLIQQAAEELAAAEARRGAIIAAQPTLRLELPEALPQAPPRLDMCSECAQLLQQMELAEEHCRAIANSFRDTFRRRAAALEQRAPGGAAATSGARDGVAAPPAPPPPPPPAAAAAAGEPAAAAAADRPAGEVQQGQRPPSQQQQQQQHDCGGGSGGGAEGVPRTPKQQPLQQPQPQQHSSSDEEQC